MRQAAAWVWQRVRGWSWRVWALWLLVIIPGVPFIVFSLGLAAFIFWPWGISDLDWPEVPAGTQHLVITAHGLRDVPQTWAQPVAEALAAQAAGSSDDASVGVAVDWSEYAQQAFRCAINGRRIGKRFGKRLGEDPALSSVHLVGHSCGAFVAYGACEVLQKASRRRVRAGQPPIAVRVTYLDPVAVYGPRWTFGTHHFGTCADFAEAYIDTADNVPGSNEPLPHAYTFDVTPARLARNDSGNPYAGNPHVWPIAFYSELIGTQYYQQGHDGAALAALARRFPPGGTEQFAAVPAAASPAGGLE